MSKGYHAFPVTEKFLPSHQYILENDKNALSLNADTTFPETPLEGMLCYRTDEEKVYIYKKVGWIEILNLKKLPLVKDDFDAFKKTYDSDTGAFTKRVDDKFTDQDKKLKKLDEKIAHDVDAKINALGKYATAASISYNELTDKPDIDGKIAKAKEQIYWTQLNGKPSLFPPESHSISKLTDLKKYGKENRVAWSDIDSIPSYVLQTSFESYKNEFNEGVQLIGQELQKLTKAGEASKGKIAELESSLSNIDVSTQTTDLLNQACDEALKGTDEHIRPLSEINLISYTELVNQVKLLQQRINGGSGGASAIYVVETGKSDKGWWRKWSDGWLEQGGGVTVANNGFNTVTVQFPKMFKDKTYHFNMMSCGYIGNEVFGSHLSYKSNDNKTTSQIIVRVVVADNPSATKAESNTWYACGYGA